MTYTIGVFVNILVLTALGLHHWRYPSAENYMLAVLIVPVFLVLTRWIRNGIGNPIVSPSYRLQRPVGYHVGIVFVWIALVAAVWVIPVFLEILKGSRYLYVSGGFTVVSAILFALGFLLVELDMLSWRTSVRRD